MAKIIDAKKYAGKSRTYYRHSNGAEGPCWDFYGDTVIVGDVPDNSYIYIEQGSLEIRGNVGDHVYVITKAKEPNFLSKVLSGLFLRAAKEPKPVELLFRGNIGNDFKLDSPDLYSHKKIVITGDLGDRAEINHFPVNTQMLANKIGNNFKMHVTGDAVQKDGFSSQATCLRFSSMGDDAKIHMTGKIEGNVIGDRALLMVPSMRLGRVGEQARIVSNFGGWKKYDRNKNFEHVIEELGHGSEVVAPNISIKYYGEDCRWWEKGLSTNGAIFRPRRQDGRKFGVINGGLDP